MHEFTNIRSVPGEISICGQRDEHGMAETCLLVRAFQSRTVRLADPEATSWPPAEKTTILTVPEWPSQERVKLAGLCVPELHRVII